MYQVKYKATVSPEGSSVKYKPLIETGIFIPKGKSCKKEKIEQQCIAFVKSRLLKQVLNMQLNVSILNIKRIPFGFICKEDEI